jgi:hypothetical protein
MIDRTMVSAIAVEFGVSWHTVNTIAAGATAVAAAGPDRLAGVRIIGIDEHRWAPWNLRIRDVIDPNSIVLNRSEGLDSDGDRAHCHVSRDRARSTARHLTPK